MGLWAALQTGGGLGQRLAGGVDSLIQDLAGRLSDLLSGISHRGLGITIRRN